MRLGSEGEMCMLCSDRLVKKAANEAVGEGTAEA